LTAGYGRYADFTETVGDGERNPFGCENFDQRISDDGRRLGGDARLDACGARRSLTRTQLREKLISIGRPMPDKG
jgi:hypothetical protein